MEIKQDETLKELNCLYKEMDDLYHEIARELGLSDSAFDILYALCALGDGCLQKDICNFSYTSKQTINSSIRKLQREGILSLKPGKGRDMHIFLTETGHQLVREKILPVMDCENNSFSGMPLGEQRELLRLTRQYLVRFRDSVATII